MWSAKVRGLSRGRCRGGQLITAKEGRKTMWRSKLSGLMIGALALVAVVGSGVCRGDDRQSLGAD